MLWSSLEVEDKGQHPWLPREAGVPSARAVLSGTERDCPAQACTSASPSAEEGSTAVAGTGLCVGCGYVCG